MQGDEDVMGRIVKEIPYLTIKLDDPKLEDNPDLLI
jgi:hypothetical protein